MTGTVYDITHDGPEGRFTALVLLAGDELPREVHYWPELLEQYGPEKLRRFLIREAAAQKAADDAAAAAAAGAEQHRNAVTGDGTADPAEFEPAEDKA